MSKLSDPFLDRLSRIVEDRGRRAALRKYWSPTTRHQAYPVLGQLGALDDVRKAVLACLYAEHPEHASGLTVGKAALRLGERKDGEHPYDRHFRRLLACQELGDPSDPDDLAFQLHRLVKRLARDGIGLDYESLLRSWTKTSDPSLREKVRLRWAADFWRSPIPEPSTSADA